MLTGKLVYKVNGKEYRYDVDAVDTSTEMRLLFNSGSKNAMNVLEFEDDTIDTNLDERRCNISLSHVVVETGTHTENGKTKKNDVNSDFFCRLGALIRYVKTNCKTSNMVGYIGMSLASKEFEAIPTRQYRIPYPTSDEIFAEVTLTYGDITAITLNTDTFTITLVENAREDHIFSKIVNGKKLGFKFDKDYLGFELPVIEVQEVQDAGNIYTSIEDIMKAHPDKELEWLLGKDYQIVTDDNLEEVCKYILDDQWEYVYYDTETTGLNITFKSRIGQADQLVGVVLSVKFGESFFFPTQMKSIPNLCNGDHFYFMERYMRPILEGKKLVAHNMSFDWKVAYIYDINANIVHDTMALIKLTLGAERKNFPMSLKELAKILLGRDSLELSDLIRDNSWGESEVKFWDLPYESVRLYACADTDNTMGLLLYAQQEGLLEKYNASKVYDIEIAFSFAVAYQEFYGHRIDVMNVDKIRQELGQEQADIMKQMVDLIGHEFNPNSPKQLQTVMYTELGIPVQKDRVSGKITTNKETLKKLAELEDINGEVKYPFCKLLQKYREYEGVRKVVDKFPEHMTSDGYIFSSVMQYGTTTGRVSINNPNYQSYNDPIKKNVIPRPGFWMFDTDYSSVEYRVLGNMVGNKRIMDSFVDPDFDYHAYQAAHMYGVPYSAVTKKLRKAAKGINFGLPYGMGDESLGVRVFGEATPENTRKAAALRQAYFKGQEDIRDWFEYHRDRGVQEGFTETYFGRRRYYHRQDFSEAKIRRQAGNQVIQGCLHGNTKIETKEFGVKPIRELVDYSGLVWNGTNWTHGDILYSGKKQKCIITFADDTEFICSPIHKFLLAGKDPSDIGNYVECKDLTAEHIIECNTSTKSSLTKISKATNKIAVNNELVVGLKVKSVEITDEYIDMYDVCNTDCGYYVADGLITHNTAADIYKTAVGRVFKRICKEGWLGKVLFTGFIHDELLGEVSNDINPGIFLKVLREEFEVKIKNTDGTPWCPLYMGFGYGMSWYEAKSVELPIKLQWEIVEKYGDTGFPEWKGDGRAFCDTIPDKLRDFDVRDIHNQLIDAESQGKEIKPTLNNQILDCVKTDAKLYTQCIQEYASETGYTLVDASPTDISTWLSINKDAILSQMDSKYHIQNLYTDTDEQGNSIYVTEFKPQKTTQDAITQYCMLHNVDRSQINLLDIEEVDSEKSSLAMADPSYYIEDEIDENTDEERKQQLIDARIQNFGVYTDIENKIARLYLIGQPYLKFIQDRTNSTGEGYNILFHDYANQKIYKTEKYITSDNLRTVQQMYIQYFNSIRSNTQNEGA